MASGSFAIDTDNKYISGTLSWSSTEDVSANTSSVTATMRLERTNTGYTTTGTGWFSITINGDEKKITNKDFSLTYNSNTLIMTHTSTVKHNSDGKKSITIKWDGDTNVYNVYAGSNTATLDTIPRASSLTTDASWTAGSYINLAISRASTSFRHEAEISVKQTDGTWNWVGQAAFSTSQTSMNYYFSVGENEDIFTQLAQRASADTRVQLQTYDGSTLIGVKDYYGTVTNPAASTVSSSVDFTIGNNVTVNLSRANSLFYHTVNIYVAGTKIHEQRGVESSYTWVPTQAQKDQMFALTKTIISTQSRVEVDTWYNGTVRVRSSNTNKYGTATVPRENPTFSSFSYADTNGTYTALTGNNQYIIQNKSNLVVTIPNANKAVAKNGADITKYVASVSGETLTVNSPFSTDVTFNFGTISAGSNQLISITAYDSRGFATTASKTAIIVPYSKPVISATSVRKDNFQAETTLTLKGTVSTLNVNGYKNTVKAPNTYYRWRKKGTTTWGTAYSFPGLTVSVPNYSAPGLQVNGTTGLDNISAWEIEITVTDNIESAVTIVEVPAGKPIQMWDVDKKSVGINKMPQRSNAFEVGSMAYFDEQALFLKPHQAVYSGLRHWKDVAGYSVGSTAGAFIIEMPYAWTNTMHKVTIEGFLYDATAPFKIEVGFYNYSGNPTPSFVNHGYVNYGAFNLKVRLGHDSTTNKNVIILGDVGYTYPYPKVVVSSVIQGHTVQPDNMAEGWRIYQTTSLSNITYQTNVPNVTLQSGLPSLSIEGAFSVGSYTATSQPYFLAYNDGTQSIPATTWTRLSLPSVSKQVGGGQYTGGQYQVPSRGQYFVYGMVDGNGDVIAGKTYYLAAFLNGGLLNHYRLDMRQAYGVYDGMMMGSTILDCAPGDGISLYLYHSDSAAMIVTGMRMIVHKLA